MCVTDDFFVNFLKIGTMSNLQGLRQHLPGRTVEGKVNENHMRISYQLQYPAPPVGPKDSVTVTKMRHYCLWESILSLRCFGTGKVLGTPDAQR